MGARRHRARRVTAAAAASTCAVALSGATADAATTVRTTYESRFGYLTVSALGSNRADRIRVVISRSGDAAIVRDPGGVQVLDDGCTEVTSTSAACFARPTSLKLRVASISGDDHVVAGSHHGFAYASVDAGPGADTVVTIGRTTEATIDGGLGDDVLRGNGDEDDLFGRNGDDRLHGGGGDDTINGGLGSDVLIAGNGRDTLFGEGGADLLLSRDRLLDKELNCGDGDDSLVRDREDPHGFSCEHERAVPYR